MTKTEEAIKEEFYENFVRFGILNDMHNRPMFYETKTDDLDKVINFFLSLRQKELQELVKKIEKLKLTSGEGRTVDKVWAYKEGLDDVVKFLKELQ